MSKIQQDGMEEALIAESAMADAFVSIFGMTRLALSAPGDAAENESSEGKQ